MKTKHLKEEIEDLKSKLRFTNDCWDRSELALKKANIQILQLLENQEKLTVNLLNDNSALNLYRMESLKKTRDYIATFKKESDTQYALAK